MASAQEAWEAYFYPETFDRAAGRGVLRNLFDERDPEVLALLEYASTTDRQAELMGGLVDVPRTYDAAHLRAIHRYLFQDVYEWAGEYRTVNIFKGTPRGFADVTTGEVDRYLGDVHALVTKTRWGQLDREGFAQRAAAVFAYVNQAHPFREGNGRASKVFMEHVAELSRFTFAYDRVSPAQWNEASKWSGPDLLAYEPHPGELVPVFRAIAVERSSASTPEMDSASRQRSLLSAAYPRAATEATRPGAASPRAGYRSGPYLPGRGHGDAGRGRER